jgi:hypothetical protein
MATGVARSVQPLGYGMEGPGFYFLFSKTSRPAPGPTHPQIQWTPCLFPGGKAAGA